MAKYLIVLFKLLEKINVKFSSTSPKVERSKPEKSVINRILYDSKSWYVRVEASSIVKILFAVSVLLKKNLTKCLLCKYVYCNMSS